MWPRTRFRPSWVAWASPSCRRRVASSLTAKAASSRSAAKCWRTSGRECPMSRIGKKPIPVPAGVKVALEDHTVRVEGPKGKLSQAIPVGLSVTMDTNVLTVERNSEQRSVRALHGLIRSLLANMVHGVKEGFERKLDIVGIGYR